MWNITGPNSGTLVSDGVFVKTFTNVGNLIGGNVSDTFIIGPGGSLSGSIDGGGPAPGNTLTGGSGPNDWSIDNANEGSVTGIASGFEDIGTLIGGVGNDTFTLGALGSLSGSLSGGSGSNTLQGPDGPLAHHLEYQRA